MYKARCLLYSITAGAFFLFSKTIDPQIDADLRRCESTWGLFALIRGHFRYTVGVRKKENIPSKKNAVPKGGVLDPKIRKT